MREYLGLLVVLVLAVGGGLLFGLPGLRDSNEPASSDPRVAAAILALAEDNVKLREAYASCNRSRSGLEDTLKKEREK